MKIEYDLLKDIKFIKNGIEYNFSNKIIKKLLSYISDCILIYGTDKNGYVDIPKINFRKIKDGDILVDKLILDGLLERNYYINTNTKNKAYGYRFSKSLIENLKIKKIIIEPKDFYIDNIVSQKNNINLKIDNKILNRLEEDYNDVEFFGDFIKKEYDEWGNFVDVSKWLSNNLKFARWKNKYKTFKWSSNRLYTNFTQLSGYARKNNIMISGEHLQEFDIKSSFPLMLCLYIVKMNPDILNNYEFKKFSDSIIEGTFYSKLQYGLNNIRNCNKSGEYYDDGEKCNGDYDTRLISKSESKILFQMFLNDKTEKNSYINNLSVDIKKYMKYNFSIVYEIVENLKKNNVSIYDILVSIETKLIFNIIDDLYSNYNDLKILTCHDAIYVPKSYTEKVNIIWEKWMNKIYNKLHKKIKKNIDFSFSGDLFENAYI